MSRKTRKQKIQADTRKQKFSATFSYRAKTGILTTRKDVYVFGFVKKDLYKTVVLGIIFLSVEIVLWLYFRK